MEIRPVGGSALLIEVPDGLAVQSWRTELLRRRTAGDLRVDEIVPGALTILLDGLEDADAVAATIRRWPTPETATLAEGPIVTIPTCYDGPDLAAVAATWGMTPEEAVTMHTATEFRVAFSGFAPGFAYLTGLPAGREVGRHATPRTRVPAGSVALADGYCGIYPTASPGGWQLIGRTDVVLFDVDLEVPALLAPGARVRFRRAEP
jgi:KipI family sensor histidine kinase inhibitor